jgi:hypothetical protein
MDGLMVNIDVTAPAATVALALMYLKVGFTYNIFLKDVLLG